MTNVEANYSSRETKNSRDPSWNRPWANEWCMSSDSYEGSDLALQARFTRFDDADESTSEQTTDQIQN